MRFLIVFILIANIALFAFGQGYFGPEPADQGRTLRQFSERMQQQLIIGDPIIDQYETNS